jgi:ABC-type sugar transport system substrate-binding protein
MDDALGERARERTIRIGFSPPAWSEFYDEVEHGAFMEMRELTERFGVRWEWNPFYPEDHQDVSHQVEALRDWAARGLDAILVCTAGEFAAMQRVYEEIGERGTLVFQFNMPAELWRSRDMRATSTVGYDNAAHSGYLACQHIAEMLGGSGRMIMISGLPSHWSTARFNGLQLALRRHPGIELVAVQRGDYVRDKGAGAAEHLLRRHPDVNAIYAENEEMALGASEAIDALGLEHWDGRSGIITIGADGLKSGCEFIQSGRLTATIDVGPVEHGRASVQAIFGAVMGQRPRHIVSLPTTIVDGSNVERSLAALTSALAVKRP